MAGLYIPGHAISVTIPPQCAGSLLRTQHADHSIGRRTRRVSAHYGNKRDELDITQVVCSEDLPVMDLP
jgi:hypothetical protein